MSEQIQNTKEITKRNITHLYDKYDKLYPNGWGWCSLDKAGCIIDYIDDLMIKKPNKKLTCVEVGVFAGKSVMPVAMELKRHRRGRIIAIDPWTNDDATKDYNGINKDFWSNIDLNHVRHIFLSYVSNLSLDGYVEVRQETSDDTEVIRDIDYLYIDGQHTNQAIKDINKFASEVSQDGYCIIDDVDWITESISDSEVIPNIMTSLGFVWIHRVDDAFVYIRKNANRI